MRNPIQDARMPTRISTFCVENPKLNLHSGILRGRASQIIHIFCTFLEYIDCVLLIFHACILYQIMYGLTFESQICPNVSTSYQRSFVYIRNLFCMCVCDYGFRWFIYIYIYTLHMGHAGIVYPFMITLLPNQRSSKAQTKQRDWKDRTKATRNFRWYKDVAWYSSASSLHGRTKSRIKIIKLSRSLSTCEFPLRSALTLPWQHILFHWVTPRSCFAATVGWVGWLKQFTPSRCLHLMLFLRVVREIEPQ